MDPKRFDSLARRLGSQSSRRSVLRIGVGASLGALSLRSLRVAAQDGNTTATDRFISIRTYPYTGQIADAVTGLGPLVALMERQAGFISIDFVEGDDEIHIVAAFLDKSSAVAAAREEDDWIAANALDILPGNPEIDSGPVFLRSELDTGCACSPFEVDSCGSDRLVCCATQNSGGICLTFETTCPATPVPTPTMAVQPTATEIPACTGEGCDCIGGVEGACDATLVCCGVTVPGGPGTCQTEEECNPPTEIPACTGDGCFCPGGSGDFCDAGLVCCGTSGPGGAGLCLTEAECAPPTPTPGLSCSSEGCTCDPGVSGSCDSGLTCCDRSDRGLPGICQSACAALCPGGSGCPCTPGELGGCLEGLGCCPTDGGAGTCDAACA